MFLSLSVKEIYSIICLIRLRFIGATMAQEATLGFITFDSHLTST